MKKFFPILLLVASRERATAESRIMLRLHACLICRVRQAFITAIFFGLLSASTAHALIIGEVVVKSRVGEPLLAYVPIFPESPDEKVTAACLSLIKAEISHGQERQDLPAARLELEGNEKIGQQIRISTADQVNAASLTIQLKANCISNGLVIREFNPE